MQQAILLVAYGAATSEGRRVLTAFDRRVRLDFPKYAVRWAYSSPVVRQRLAQIRLKSDSVVKALRRISFERFAKVVVQPLQTIPGLEHEEIVQEASAIMAETGLKVQVGLPLLAADRDVERLAASLLLHLPKERRPSEEVVFMGHGSKHPASHWYAKLHWAVQNLDRHVHVGTMEGAIGLDELLPNLSSRRVWLMPLLATVGRHTLVDMAGQSRHSWRSRLEELGHQCVPVLKGTMEHNAIAEIWLEHLLEAAKLL